MMQQSSHSPQKALLLLATALLMGRTGFSADSGEPGQQKRAGPPPGWRVVSPEIHQDGTVTFRIYAPGASRVLLEAFDMVGKHRELSREEGGVWSITVGPVKPDLYTYKFLVDQVSTIDPKNNLGQYRSSLIEVKGRESEFLALRDVPHGVIHQHLYGSGAIGGIRGLYVYTPPRYDENGGASFPVLYLLHGSGETEQAWSSIGRAGVILDNLLARGKAKPMIIAMPYGHTAPPSTRDWPFTASEAGLFPRELLDDILPLVEKKYRISRKRECRAIAGFSMGGAQALQIGLKNLDLFSQLGVFSWGGGRDLFEKRLPSVLSRPEWFDEKIRLFWIGCGRGDFLHGRATALHECLRDLKIRHVFVESEGGHSWINWRRYLHQYAQLLFQGS